MVNCWLICRFEAGFEYPIFNPTILMIAQTIGYYSPQISNFTQRIAIVFSLSGKPKKLAKWNRS